MKKKKLICIMLSLVLLFFCSCKKEDDELDSKILEYRQTKFAYFTQENDEFADYQCDVAFLGDSLTDGYPVKEHYFQYVVSNRGISGETTTGLEENLQTTLYDLKPKVATLLIGANNMSTMFDNYENILRGFVENVPNTKIILLSLTSMSGEWGKKNQLACYNNVKIEMLAEKYGFEYVDLFSALLNLETGEIYQEYTTDGGHLTNAGYNVLTEKITPAIEKQLTLWHIENQI